MFNEKKKIWVESNLVMKVDPIINLIVILHHDKQSNFVTVKFGFLVILIEEITYANRIVDTRQFS